MHINKERYITRDNSTSANFVTKALLLWCILQRVLSNNISRGTLSVMIFM